MSTEPEVYPTPPSWPTKVLRALVRTDYIEEIEGDMEERFLDNLELFSEAKSRRLFIWDTLKLIRPRLLKKLGGDHKLNHYGMFENYLKITLRNIKKRKIYSAIKIGGFAIGIALSILISLFVIDEIRVDQHLSDKPVYRLLMKGIWEGDIYHTTSVPPVLAPSLVEDYPEVVTSGRMIHFDGFGDTGGNLVRMEGSDKSIYEERFGYADPEIPDMLEFVFVHGDRSTALVEPMTLILSKRKADKYFPGQNPVGKLLYLNENQENPYKITGVFESLKATHLNQFDFFFTLSGKEFWPGEQRNWCCNNYTTYIEVDENTTAAFEAKLKLIHDQYFVTYAEEDGDARLDLIKAHHSLVMQKVSDVHLHSAHVFDFLTVSDITMVWAFAAIAVFILLLACINFINLSTANSASRAREIGLRKAVGCRRKDIISQFLIEAIVLTFVAVVLGTILASMAMPLFNSITDKTLVFPYGSPFFYLVLLILTIVIGVLSGIYPSFYLSSFEPITALNERLGSKGKKSNVWLRNVLVLFQLIISTMLIAGAISVYRQMEYILTKDVGFDKDQMVIIQGFNSLGDQMESFKNEVVNLPGVANATISSSLPVEGTRRNGNEFWKAGRRGIDKPAGGQFWQADGDYFATLGIEFVEGRPFDLDKASDSTAAVINETMVKKLGLEDPLNAEVENFLPWKIVGVVKDFHFTQFNKDAIRPLLVAPSSFGDMLTVKISSKDMAGSMAQLETLWDRFKPNQFFRYDFLDRRYEAMYEGVERTKTLLLIFAAFSVIVACLGLFGLSVFTVAQRNKEMTIRKVLGASVQRIIRLLTVDYLKLVVLALIVALPSALYFVQEWLEPFKYKIPHIWDVLVLAGFLVISLAWEWSACSPTAQQWPIQRKD